MQVSALYKNLEKRRKGLEKQFCGFDQIDSALPKNQDDLRSFKLLVHAEIESYIESAVLKVWEKCNAEWTNNKKVIGTLSFLILFATSKFEANEKQLEINDRIDQILESFKKTINNNHGIKKENILKLVIPIGVDYASIDATWLTTIDSYGSSRGEVAHKSCAVQKQLDKNDELKTLKLVFNGLKEIDIKIQKLYSIRRKPF
jgi:hypothetical protein